MIDAILADHKDDILDMRRRGVSKQEIALTFHVCAKHLRLALNEWGDTSPLPARARLEDMKDAVIADWRGGATRKELTVKYGVGLDAIQRKLREWGESKLRGGRYNKYEMQRLRDAGLTGEEIAGRLGCALQTVYAYTQPSDEKEAKKNPEPVRLPEYLPGERYGRFRFIKTIPACRPLWLFQHVAAGWKETFTESQLREARLV